MILFVLVFLGGVLTIVSPCILPVLPFVFARTGRPFLSSTLPMLLGMAVTFAAVASLAATGGNWAVQANEVGRVAAMVLLALFGLTLVFSGLAARVMQPLVALGARWSRSADAAAGTGRSAVLPSALLGVATGLLWAPCAGPILGLILTGAALRGASVETSLLLVAYAAGAATSLALALLLGGRVFRALKRSLGFGEWLRRGLGVAVLLAVSAIGLRLDTTVLAQVSLAGTTSLEQALLARLQPGGAMSAGPSMSAAGSMSSAPSASKALPVEDEMPPLGGAVQWLNSPPLTKAGLRGKVVIVDFWTYSCINCLRELPYVKAWSDKYRDQGLVVIGVHAPEFAFEKNVDNVQKAVSDLGLDFPVAIDNNFVIWRNFDNAYWPAEYFVDAQGRVRHHVFGEGDYDQSEQVIQQLLAEAGQTNVPSGLADVSAAGAQAAPDLDNVRSPETYLGAARAQHFVSPGGLQRGSAFSYTPGSPKLNEWGFTGDWTAGGESSALNEAGGGIVYRFHARDLHLVLGPATTTGPVRFRVTIDGAPPGDSHGVDTDAEGQGVVTDQRLYQLVRQTGAIADHTFEIQFLDSGVQAYAFTFG